MARRHPAAVGLARRGHATRRRPRRGLTQQRLCVSTAGWLVSVLVGQDAPVDDVGQASLERSTGLSWGLAFAQLAQVVAAAGSGIAGLADRDGVQGGVELAVAAGVDSLGRRGCQVGLVAWLTILGGVVRLALGKVASCPASRCDLCCALSAV